MFGKFFASTFTGSMFGAGADVFAVWGYVIANAVEGHVELNPLLIAAILGVTTERVTAAIDKLCEPDAKSRNPEQDGKRLIQEGQYQYRVVSHSRYRAVRNEEDRRAYNRQKQQEHRARKVIPPVNDSQSLSTLSAHTEAEAEADTEAERVNTRGRNGKTTKTGPLDEAWEQFKAAYPSKRRENGYMALQRFIAACDKVGPACLLAALEKHKRSEDWKKGMIPGLEKWLEKELWIQEPETPDTSHNAALAHLKELDRRKAEQR